MPTAGFEGVIASNDSGQVPAGYDGYDWSDFGAIGKGYIKTHVPDSGFHNVLDGKVVASIGSLGNGVHGAIFPEHAGDIFTIRSGTFASAWNKHQTVTFHAFLGGDEVGTLSVVLNKKAVMVTFNSHFAHIDELTITSSGGVDADPDDSGAGPFVTADDLVLSKPSAVHAAPHTESVSHMFEPQLPFDHTWHGMLA